MADFDFYDDFTHEENEEMLDIANSFSETQDLIEALLNKAEESAVMTMRDQGKLMRLKALMGTKLEEAWLYAREAYMHVVSIEEEIP